MPSGTKRPVLKTSARKFLLSALFGLALAGNALADETSYAISIYGDIKYPAGFTHFDYTNPDAPKGGEIIMPDIGNFDNVNPFILKGHPVADSDLMFDTLMSGAADETSTSYGLIAKSVEFPKDNSYVIFNLRPEAKFSDGSELTADDVVFSFNTLKDKGHPIYKIMFGEIKSATKLGKYKVRFDFSNPKTRELKIVIGSLPVFSKKYYDTHEFGKTTLEQPLGSGPYVIENIDPGRSITYKRRADYWAKDLPVNKGRYNFERIKHEYYLDVNVAIQAFKSGVVDLRYENSAKNWANAYNIPAIKEGKIIKEKLKNEIPQGMQAFAFNLRHDKFKDVRVRHAISLALDFEWMNHNLFYNSYTRNDSYFANSIYASSGIPQGKELELLKPFAGQLPPELFSQPFKLPVSDGSGYIRPQLVEAMKLLNEAGWHIKNGQLQNAKGEPLNIEILVIHGSGFERIFGSFQKNLELLGIGSSIKSVDSSQYKELSDSFDFDMCIQSWHESLSPGTEQMNYWHSSSADVKGSENIAGIKNPVVDALILDIIKAQDKDDLIAATRALDRVLLWNYYSIPNWYIGSFRLLYWNKFERPKILPKYDAGFGLMEWWVKPEKK